MSDHTYSLLIILTCFVGWVMTWLPCLIYLSKTWANRRDRLFAVFGSNQVALYYGQFFPAVDISHDTPEQLTDRFKKGFFSLYGRRRYIWPLLLLALIASIGAWGTAQTIRVWVGVSQKPFTFDAMVIAAFLGALVWVINDQLERLRSRDFTYHDVYNCVFRFLIAVPFGYALSRLASKEFGVGLAFLLGTFPTATLFKYGRRLVTQQLKLGEPGEAGRTELESLQSVGRANAERFMDEGFTTIAELAWGDPVDLTFRTNRDLTYIVDCVSQALLWVYFGDKASALYKLSLRGAQEAVTLVESLSSSDASVKDAASKTLDEIARVVGISRDATFYTLLKQVHSDPYTRFLVGIWQ